MQAVAADSADSTAHNRLHNPILSVSPHITHLLADHSHARHASAPASRQHSLFGTPGGISRQHSSILPNGLPQAVDHSPGDVSAPQSAAALPTSAPSHVAHAHSGSGHARAQRQLFASLSDHTTRPSRLGSDAAAQAGNASRLESSGSGAYQAQEPSTQEPSTPDSEPQQLSLAELCSRQRLFVCKMCRNPTRGLLCEPSSVQRIDYYQGNDMPLASFLAATAPQKCPHVACGDGVTAHLRTFLHNRGRVTLSVSQMPAGKELPGADKGQVWFWARPLQVCHIQPLPLRFSHQIHVTCAHTLLLLGQQILLFSALLTCLLAEFLLVCMKSTACLHKCCYCMYSHGPF